MIFSQVLSQNTSSFYFECNTTAQVTKTRKWDLMQGCAKGPVILDIFLRKEKLNNENNFTSCPSYFTMSIAYLTWKLQQRAETLFSRGPVGYCESPSPSPQPYSDHQYLTPLFLFFFLLCAICVCISSWSEYINIRLSNAEVPSSSTPFSLSYICIYPYRYIYIYILD